MSKGVKIGFGIFLASFLPYVYLVYVAIFGMEFTWFFSTQQCYGYQAVMMTLFFGCIIPVYPVVLIFQCIYGFVTRKKLPAEKKRLVLVIILSLITTILLGCGGHFVREKVTIQYHYNQDKALIEAYLKEYFGERHFADMEIQPPDEISHSYRVTTPLLKYSFDINLNEERTAVNSSTFQDNFIEENNLHQKVGEYVTKQWAMPEHTQVGVVVLNLDITEYDAEKTLDSFLTTCSYRVDSIYIDRDVYRQEEIVETIKKILLQYDEELSTYCQDDRMKFYVRVNDEYHASILVLHSKESKNSRKLIFDGYTDSEGTTIPYEEMVLDLSE